MAIPAGFVDALAAHARLSPANMANLELEVNELRKLVASGKKDLIQATINGKTWSWANTTISVEDKFTAFSQALARAKNRAVTRTIARYA